ncbi:MAG: methyltransferase domain-containing protein [Myxococcales bacterium]|nr:methyltransferase domain-containing protein [Myxococcales bacterium]MCB9715436.1 methyltransferase domain-containing protein [Myxococcales bacterium]
MSDPKQYAGYIDAEHLDVIAGGVAELKRRILLWMEAGPGQRVLDVGCGPGIDTLALAERVGPTGEVVGVDYDEEMVAEAERRAAQAGVAARVRHLHADATALPLPDDHFDACRCERVLQHVRDPEAALDELVRVTRPGGWIVVADPDQGTASIDTAEVEVERTLMRLRAEAIFHNGFSGRRLLGQLHRRGLQELAVELHPLRSTDYPMLRRLDFFERLEQAALATGAISGEQLQRWHHDLERAHEERRFFATVTVVMVAGRKPSRAPATGSG